MIRWRNGRRYNEAMTCLENAGKSLDVTNNYGGCKG